MVGGMGGWPVCEAWVAGGMGGWPVRVRGVYGLDSFI